MDGLFKDQDAVQSNEADNERWEKLKILALDMKMPLQADLIHWMTFKKAKDRLSLETVRSHPALWSGEEFANNLYIIKQSFTDHDFSNYLRDQSYFALYDQTTNKNWFNRLPPEWRRRVIDKRNLYQSNGTDWVQRYQNEHVDEQAWVCTYNMCNLIRVLRNLLEHDRDLFPTMDTCLEQVVKCFPDFLPVLWNSLRDKGTFIPITQVSHYFSLNR